MSVGGLTGCPGSEMRGGVWCRGVGGKRGGGHLGGREEIVGWSTKFTNKEVHKKGLCVREGGGTGGRSIQQEYRGHFAPTRTLGVG